MQYQPQDFGLYLLSLAIPAALITPALPHVLGQAAFLSATAYLAWSFRARHGVKRDPSTLRVIREGLAAYPGVLARSWRTARDWVVPSVVIFALALGAERYLEPALAGTMWLRPLPWLWMFWVPFLLVTAFRLAILVAHLLRTRVVREVLERSPQQRMIARLSIPSHVVQAFVTGVVAHLSLMAPCILFFIWTEPTYLREALLLGGYLAWTAIATPLRRRKRLASPGLISNLLVYQNHKLAHESRFYFTVFHGHHHDAIPSALIGSAAGSGFLENVDRSLTWLYFLNSATYTQLHWMYVVAFDMVVHQYIPGIFPFAKPNVMGLGHHVAHHFGSLTPLGVIFFAYVDPNDIRNGYKPDNRVTRWFIDEVERREGLDPQLKAKYLSLDNYTLPGSKPAAPAAESRA
jgi:hypothetical protein